MFILFDKRWVFFANGFLFIHIHFFFLLHIHLLAILLCYNFALGEMIVHCPPTKPILPITQKPDLSPSRLLLPKSSESSLCSVLPLYFSTQTCCITLYVNIYALVLCRKGIAVSFFMNINFEKIIRILPIKYCMSMRISRRNWKCQIFWLILWIFNSFFNRLL